MGNGRQSWLKYCRDAASPEVQPWRDFCRQLQVAILSFARAPGVNRLIPGEIALFSLILKGGERFPLRNGSARREIRHHTKNANCVPKWDAQGPAIPTEYSNLYLDQFVSILSSSGGHDLVHAQAFARIATRTAPLLFHVERGFCIYSARLGGWSAASSWRAKRTDRRTSLLLRLVVLQGGGSPPSRQ